MMWNCESCKIDASKFWKVNKELKALVFYKYIYIYIYIFWENSRDQDLANTSSPKNAWTSAYIMEKMSNFSQPSPDNKMEFVVCEDREIIIIKK